MPTTQTLEQFSEEVKRYAKTVYAIDLDELFTEQEIEAFYIAGEDVKDLIDFYAIKFDLQKVSNTTLDNATQFLKRFK